MAPAEPSVPTALVKVDHLSLEQVRKLDDSVIGEALRRFLDHRESQTDAVAAFTNRI